MFILKLYNHIWTLKKWIVYRLMYGKKWNTSLSISFRTGFHAIIESKGVINIGKSVFFNNYCTIAFMSSITIGDGTLFGENVKIYDRNHCYKDKDTPIKEQGYTTAPIVIGKHCWIASNVGNRPTIPIL